MKPIDGNLIQQIVWNMQSMSLAITVSTICIILGAIILTTMVLKRNIWEVLALLFSKGTWRIGILVGKKVRHLENDYKRSVEVGKYDEKSKSVRWYKFLSELIIDLGLKNKGATPYSFLFILIVSSILGSILTTQLLFSSTIIGIIICPIFFTFLLCVSYTKANLAHDARLEAIIEAENIISNNIKGGVLKAVKENIEVIPEIVRDSYRQFIDDIEQRNTPIEYALSNLSDSLGSASEEFIENCKVFELAETYGMVGMFQDIVEINNTKTKFRTNMKIKFEVVVNKFIAGAFMIIIFLVGFIALYEQLSTFYFTNLLGQILLSLDMLVLVSEFVFITYLRAQEV